MKKSRKEIEFPFKYFSDSELVQKEEFQTFINLVIYYISKIKNEKGHNAQSNLENIFKILDSFNYFVDTLAQTEKNFEKPDSHIHQFFENVLKYLSKERRNINQVIPMLKPDHPNLSQILDLINKTAVEIFFQLFKLRDILKGSVVLSSNVNFSEKFEKKIVKEINNLIVNFGEYDLMMLEGEDACLFLKTYFDNQRFCFYLK